MKTVLDLLPSKGNARNSEGDFLRTSDGKILFAYSRFSSESGDDDAVCDISCLVSDDEGETWKDIGIIAKAADFGVNNVMSVSAMPLKDGTPAFYFLIKENDGTSTIGRTVLDKDLTFKQERCICNFESGYYVINNGRFIRLNDGRVVAPGALHRYVSCEGDGSRDDMEANSTTHLFISDDDGKTFNDSGSLIELSDYSKKVGIFQQEPGILELSEGRYYLWARTNAGTQYYSYSDKVDGKYSEPLPSEFISPCSPLSAEICVDDIFVVYNPNPAPHPKGATMGRTQLVIRRGNKNTMNFGPCVFLETTHEKGFCYASIFKTNDNSLLVSYCRGGEEIGCCLHGLRITKISLNEIN